MNARIPGAAAHLPRHMARQCIFVRPFAGGPFVCCSDWDEVGDLVDGNEGAFVFEFHFMTDAEVAELGEFEGW